MIAFILSSKQIADELTIDFGDISPSYLPLANEYLLDFSHLEFTKDIKNSIRIFREKLGYNPIYFSYPFGEYNLEQTQFIKNNFKYGFGQHSGVIDLTKNPFELPRFPINEKYGDLDRFEFIIKLFPIPYK